MKRSSKILAAVLVAGGVITGAGVYNATLASADDQKMATKAMQEYAFAFQGGDISAMTKHVKDTRYRDENSLKAAYEGYIEQEKKNHSQLKLVSVDKGSNGFNVTFEQSTDEHGPVQFSLPVIKDGDTWKLLVDGSLVIDTKKAKR